LSPFRGGLRQPHPWTGNFFARGVLVQLAVLKKVCGSDTKGRLLAGRRHTFSEERRQGNGLVPQGGPEAGGLTDDVFPLLAHLGDRGSIGIPSLPGLGEGPPPGGLRGRPAGGPLGGDVDGVVHTAPAAVGDCRRATLLPATRPPPPKPPLSYQRNTCAVVRAVVRTPQGCALVLIRPELNIEYFPQNKGLDLGDARGGRPLLRRPPGRCRGAPRVTAGYRTMERK